MGPHHALGLPTVGGLAVLAACAVLAGCGGPGTPAASHGPHTPPASRAAGEPLAGRICGGARQEAASALGSPLSARVVSPAAADLRCVLTGRQVRVSIESQAGTRAYTEFNTEVSHQDQVFGPGVHEPGQIPSVIAVPGSVVAVWIRAQDLLVATNATPSTGGAYVTVAVSGRAASGATALRLATAAARATFAAHPSGP